MKLLWGETYLDPANGKWTTSSISAVNGNKLKRGFVQFILEPIYNIFELLKDESIPKVKIWEALDPIISKLGVKLTQEEREDNCKAILKSVMQKFLPAHEALLEMIVNHLPSPVEAQSYRYSLLYTGPLDDPYATAIKNCDKNGPLMLFVSKMVPTADASRFIAFGRVFSGTCHSGQKVRIMGNEYEVESISTDKDVFHGAVNKTLLMMGRSNESIDEVPAGNVCGLIGVDKYLSKSGTITNEECKDACPLKNMKYSVSPVVQVAVEPENPADIKKLVEGLKRLSKSDPLVQCFKSDTGQFVVAGSGELHLEICLGDLEREYCNGTKIKRSNPVVTFCETVISKSEACLAKSANKLNRLYIQAEAVQSDLVDAVEAGTIKCFDEPKALAKLLKDQFSWDASDARKIWCFGPETGSNILVDMSKGVDYLNEIQEPITSSFRWASKHGVLCEENMRGVRFNVLDVTVHQDAAHRGSGQIMPAARRAFNASQLSAEPRIVEPIYLVEIQTNTSVVGNVYNIINKKRGMIVGTETISGTPIVNVRAHLPVLESFGLTEMLRGATGGQAFPQCSFDHWQVLENSDPYDPASRAHEIVKSIRARKGLKTELPQLSEFLDKL
jgi:elongation factor 2